MDENGLPIDKKHPVPLSGRASMWKLVPEMRENIHKERVNIGMKGYFMEGARKIGEVTVGEIVGLNENHA